ncbi:hypothetical protein J2X65_000686 [Ancylobacter sp. 3268]|uniref:hypothetical protein n=1 Tax=Ancylobacter sp. 3268 TaxID=2817752 RepID=UPI00285635F5|nr:hypothetical protein [Ancylobacter sp. 3268]MDR6951338.1 hypothetical protein [Ancylobacter sp. 3268]
MNIESSTIDRIELSPPRHVKARAATVDLGARFVACLAIGLLLSGAASISQAVCSYNRMVVSAAAATETAPDAPVVMAAGPAQPALQAAGDLSESLPCDDAGHVAPARMAAL